MHPIRLAALTLAVMLAGCTNPLAPQDETTASDPAPPTGPPTVPIIAIFNEAGANMGIVVTLVEEDGGTEGASEARVVYEVTKTPDVTTPPASMDPICRDDVERVDVSPYSQERFDLEAIRVPFTCSTEDHIIFIDDDGSTYFMLYTEIFDEPLPESWNRGDPWPWR